MRRRAPSSRSPTTACRGRAPARASAPAPRRRRRPGRRCPRRRRAASRAAGTRARAARARRRAGTRSRSPAPPRGSRTARRAAPSATAGKPMRAAARPERHQRPRRPRAPCRRAGSPCASTRRRRGTGTRTPGSDSIPRLMPERQLAPAVGPQQLVGDAAAEQRERERRRARRRRAACRRARGASRRAGARACRTSPRARRRARTARARAPAGSSSTIQCSAPKAASARKASPRAVGTGSVGSLGQRARGRGGARGAHPATASIAAAAAGCAWSRKPWQPATSNTARRFGSAPGTTSTQPPGVRPSPRGGRSIGARGDEHDEAAAVLRRDQRRADRLVDQRQPHVRRRPRQQVLLDHVRAPVAGQQQRAAACGARSARTATRRRGPRCRARPATPGARGSSTTSGRESASEISLRSISPWPRATAGQWMRDAGEPGAVLAQAVDLGLGGRDQRGAGVRGRRVAAAGGGAHRQHAREHEDLVAVGAGDDALGEAERVAQDERGRREPAPAAAPERHLDAHARGALAGAEAHRLGQQRLVDPAGRQRQPPGAWRGCAPPAAAPRARCARSAHA